MKNGILVAAALIALGNNAAVLAAADIANPQCPPCISWRDPKMEPRFALLCVHGLGLYSRSYEAFAKRLSKLGAIVYAIDVRGFGSWMNAKGHQNIDFDACLTDIKTTLDSIHKAHPNLPVFILGESMGGAIALRAATMYPESMAGLISAVPAGERFNQTRTDLKVALQFLSGPRRKRTSIGKQVVEQASTNRNTSKVNQELADAWESDPLDRLDLSPKDLMQFQAFMNDNHDAVKNLKVPVLFMQGLNDDLVRPDGTWDLLQDCKVADRSLVALPARHLMFEQQQTAKPEINRAVTQVSYAWINAHTPDPVSNVASDPAPQTVPAQVADQVTGGIPTVVAFYAKWCDQCDKLSAFVDRAAPATGKRVRFIKFDVDDPANADLIKQFSVGALPQVVFLRPDGTITGTVIGESTLQVLIRQVADLVAGQKL